MSDLCVQNAVPNYSDGVTDSKRLIQKNQTRI